MRQRWQKKWKSLSAREKQALRTLGIALVIALGYVAVLSSCRQQVNSLRESIHYKQTVLAWMANTDIKPVQHSPTTLTHTPLALLEFLQTHLKQTPSLATMMTLQQTTSNTVSLQGNQVAFDSLLSLLIITTQQTLAVINQFSSTATATPGIVTAEVNLSLPPST